MKQSKEEAVKNGRKGGIKSGESRRRKANLRKLAQQVLLDKHTDKNGKEFTGEEAFVIGLTANLANPNSRNWGKAMDLIIQLTGANKTEEECERIKAEIELTKAKTKQLAEGKSVIEVENLATLADMLKLGKNDEENNAD